MPLGHKTPEILANEIEMHRLVHPGAFLVLEGKDDLRFWRARHHERCALVDGEGKQNVVGAVRRLDSHGLKGALGLVDSDYDTFRSREPLSANVVTTDAHDLECVLCRSKALDLVLAEHGHESKIKRFEDKVGTDVRQALLDRALVFGRVRLAAILWHEKKALHQVRVQRFVDEKSWRVDRDDLLKTVVKESSREREAWEDRTDQLLHEDPWFVARGHDMLEILGIGLRRVLGDLPASKGVQAIASGLRLAMERDCLEATGLWKGIRAWGVRNPAFSVLPH